ncbi:alkylated DNA repair protein alkB homolog 8 [Chanos chanos]|uniref:tRNA (carboxymethyluridine(34)-5-O)-methyltransferase n=1 Tax=Chanos chanos TaxID=29144 RepID=A0A6J2VKI3_CHACN|nr:alkylated DNA repair protein alkB homolog 8 [Chanos chanos]
MDPSVDSMRSTKRTKEEKKFLRKQIKMSHTLLRHDGISTLTQPTKSLVVANGGLGNGVARETLEKVLREAGSVTSLLMPPDKPYAFVIYESAEDGQRAHALLNGYTLQCQGQIVTLYLSYIENMESKRSTCTDWPPGLCVLEEFVSPEEETELLGAVEWTSHSSEFSVQRALKHRRVRHYGYEFRYDNNNVDKDKPLCGGLPQVCNAVMERCLRSGHIKVLPDQLTVNQYEAGQGIPPHVDTHSAFDDTILSLSLGAKTVMDFRHPDGRSVAVVLPRRSLLVMRGESRYLWTHGITPRKFDVVPTCEGDRSVTVTSDLSHLTLSKRDTRTSFTFRKVRRTPCDCVYPSACDSQRATPSLPHTEEEACRLEAEFVHQVYEEISAHFSSTRHSPWPRVRDFLLSLPPGSILADVGCGNGKYLGINPDVITLGFDRSSCLVGICADKGFEACVSDALCVPLRSRSCDACISIAVIHHFSTQDRRLAAVKELMRLLKPGGLALIYVWALEQELNKQKSKYLKQNKEHRTEENQHLDHSETELHPHNTQEDSGKDCPLLNDARETSQKDSLLPEYTKGESGKDTQFLNYSGEDSGKLSLPKKLSVHTNRTAFNSQDLLVPWHMKSNDTRHRSDDASADGNLSKSSPVHHRYYHVFQQGELEQLCSNIKDAMVKNSYYDQGNWCVILEKIPENC